MIHIFQGTAEGCTQSVDDQSYVIGVNDASPSIEVLYCNVSEDINSSSYIVEDVDFNTLNIANLDFKMDSSPRDPNKTLHVPTTEELLEEHCINAVIEDVVHMDEGHDIYEKRDEEDLFSDYDYLLLDPIIEVMRKVI